MRPESHSLSWQSLSKARRHPGVYAWYYSPLIPLDELKESCDLINHYCMTGNPATARQTVENLLIQNVLLPLAPLDYHVHLSAELGPPYQGTAHYTPQLSPEFLDRLVKDPARLYELRTALASLQNHMQSPLYIGKSNDIRTRLRSHKYAIQTGNTRAAGDLETHDKTFAHEVRKRQLLVPRLSVEITYTETAGKPTDLEHVLNRSTFPAFGRK